MKKSLLALAVLGAFAGAASAQSSVTSEDLGGGLRAVYQLENGFSVDDGTLGQGGRIFGRWAWAGLAGSWGEVRLGRQWAYVRITWSCTGRPT